MKLLKNYDLTDDDPNPKSHRTTTNRNGKELSRHQAQKFLKNKKKSKYHD